MEKLASLTLETLLFTCSSVLLTRPTSTNTVSKPIYIWTRWEQKANRLHSYGICISQSGLTTDKYKLKHTKISYHANFDVPFNKLNKVPNHKNRAEKSAGKTTKPGDSKDLPHIWYSCNSRERLLPDCPTCENCLKERKAKKEAQQKFSKKEYVSMAAVIDFSPIKTNIGKKSQSYISPVSPKLISAKTTTVPLIKPDWNPNTAFAQLPRQ
jgi:hypothetical protein